VTRGSVFRLVNTHGSSWGRIRPSRDDRVVFFNAGSLVNPAEFASIEMDQVVDFEELPDPVNGTRATQMILVSRESVAVGAAP